MDSQEVILNFKNDSHSEPEPKSVFQPQQKNEPPPQWESMQARPSDPSEPLDEIEARLVKVFKENHIVNDPQASQDMEMISTGTMCKKCLLFKSVCRVIGHQVKKNEAESQAKNLIPRHYSI